MSLIFLDEPRVEFGHGQKMHDPRDGLTLFGPFDGASPTFRWGAVGTPRGLGYLDEWVTSIQSPVFPPAATRAKGLNASRVTFPGYEAAFRSAWPSRPSIRCAIDETELNRRIHIAEVHQRVYGAVSLFSDPIENAVRTEDAPVNLWLVVVPDELWKYCRPLSKVPKALQEPNPTGLTLSKARKLAIQPDLFSASNEIPPAFEFEPHFHNQLKARMLGRAVIQIVKESTMAPTKVLGATGRPLVDHSKKLSEIAWNLSTTVFYKAGARPWRLGEVREGVCYLGLVFKLQPEAKNPKTACCAAQMFLDSGDGFVFRGALGPWYNPQRGDCHLNQNAARELAEVAIREYSGRHGKPPKEIFIHSTTRFGKEEWNGFQEAAAGKTSIVGVRVQEDSTVRLYSPGDQPVLRGTAWLRNENAGFLWTRGFAPRLGTYEGREVPKPLNVEISQGQADIQQVMRDLLALTKLNYNACKLGDGKPVTLRFADAVGEILTSGSMGGSAPLPFKYYI